MNADTIISPRVDHEIRKRAVNYKRRTWSPNFRDILRHRFRERVKARRGALFDNLRSLETEESVRDALSQYIECDLRDLQASCALDSTCDNEEMDVVQSEPLSNLGLSDEERWILEEYDRLVENNDAQVELANSVTCPVCLRGVLAVVADQPVISCSHCFLRLPDRLPLPQLERLIVETVECHGHTCSGQLQFGAFNIEDADADCLKSLLWATCDSCYYMQDIA